MLDRFSLMQFIIVTLGADGSILVGRKSMNGLKWSEKEDAAACTIEAEYVKDLMQQKMWSTFRTEKWVGAYCPAEKVEKIVDTIGCGDSFCGAITFSILQEFDIKKGLHLASYVAARKCEGSSLTLVPHLSQIPAHLLS